VRGKMKRLTFIGIIILIFLTGCTARNSVVGFVKGGGLETKGLVNLALASNGTTVEVSQVNPDRPASNLIDGITSSDNWDQGEGWETNYEGFYARGEYVYGEDPTVTMQRMRDRSRNQQNQQEENLDSDDPAWRGLRTQTQYGNVDTAMGWVIIDFPSKKTVNRAIIYTINSEKYPASRYGVADLMLQFWSDSVKSWAIVERIGKNKDQAANAIQDNKSGVITIRFQPVETSKMRLVIRWTNDSKSERKGYYQYTMGTIRIAEVEIYGYEKAAPTQTEEEKAIVSIQDANAVAEIQAVIDNYIYGYNKKNVDMAMASISPNYSKDSDDYSDLRAKIESAFAEYEPLKIEVRNVKVTASENDATAISSYTVQHGSSTSSGSLVFSLSKASGFWKITRMDQR
jgi:hypothetical protein